MADDPGLRFGDKANQRKSGFYRILGRSNENLVVFNQPRPNMPFFDQPEVVLPPKTGVKNNDSLTTK